MSNIVKSFITAVAGLALVTGVSSASAATVSNPGPITVTGVLDQGLATPFGPIVLGTCALVFNGTSDSTGFNLNSYTGQAVSGNLDCNDGLVTPIRIDAVSSTQVKIQSLTVNHRYGSCSGTNINVPWNNALSRAEANNAVLGYCSVTGNLTVSPAKTISN